MKPFNHTAEFANAARVYAAPGKARPTRSWVKVNGKLECRYEMRADGR